MTKLSFNLPEGRDGFKSVLEKLVSQDEVGFNLPEGREGFKRKKGTWKASKGYFKFQSTRRQRRV